MRQPLDIYAEVISAAKAHTHFEDFKVDGRLTGNIRKGYDARLAAFRQLEEQGFVRLNESRLTLGTLTQAPWLSEGITNGDSIAWDICDSYPVHSRKFEPDSHRLAEIGLGGEEFVLNWLATHLPEDKHDKIQHIAAKDDSAGFDISTPALNIPGLLALEIKTSTRSSDAFNFFLSRNEWNTSQRLKNWYLVLVIKQKGSHHIFGYLDGQSLGSYFPIDSHPHFSWTTSKGKLMQDDIFQVMPGF